MRFAQTVAAACLLVGGLVFASRASAQSETELNAARQLFAEGISDEEHGRFAAALEKYKRVQSVRDTANVRYRMGAALEGLGKVARAVDAYSAAVRLGAGGGSADVVRSAQARLDVLRGKVGHVALTLPVGSWPDAEVAIDGEPVPREALADVAVDPGSHVITATAKGARPFRGQITVSEGSGANVPIVLEAEAAAPPPPPPPPSEAPYKTIGIITAAAGGVLVVGGIVVLVLRHSAISTLTDACPDGNCPASRESELRSTHDRAVAEGPIGVALLATGVAAVGTGVVLYMISGREKTTATRLVPSPTSHGAMFTLARAF